MVQGFHDAEVSECNISSLPEYHCSLQQNRVLIFSLFYFSINPSNDRSRMVQTHPDDQLRRQPKHFWKVHAKYDTSVQEYRERLQTANFTLTKRCSKRLRARLPVLDSRAQRGMLIYEKCTYRELRTFCKQRGINAGTDRSVPKTQLIRLLETADTTCVFPFFEGLPPEMRLRIYAFSFQFFRHDVQSANVKPEPQLILYHMYYKDPGQHNPWNTTGPDMVRTSEDQQDNRAYSVLKLCPPPLSHICGLLRREVLPLFYTKSTLVSSPQNLRYLL